MGKKINEEIKNKIIDLYNNGKSSKQIKDELNIGLSFIYKTLKNLKTIDEVVETSEIKINDVTPVDNNISADDEDDEAEKNETSSLVEFEKDETNETNEIKNINASFNKFLKNEDEAAILQSKNEVSDISNVSHNQPKIINKIYKFPSINKNAINHHDISICKNENVDLSNDQKNQMIVKIRNYYKYFYEDLKAIIDSKKINLLFKMNYTEINAIYELIRIEIKFKSSIDFKNLAETSLETIEKLTSKTSYDLTGLKSELFTDEIFTKNLTILQIEKGNIFDFLTPERIILLLFLKKSYQCYNINKINKNANEIITKDINNSFVEKYKNL